MTSRISEQNAFLVRVSDAVRGLNDPDAVARTACGLVAAHLGATESHWNEVDWEKRDFVVRDGFHNRDVQSVLTGRHAFASAGPAGAALLSGRSFLIEDARDDARLPSSMREALGERHMVSLLVVPVMVNGALRASLTVTQSAPRRWSTEEVALVEAVAARTWAEIERASAVSALEVELADTRELQRISSSLIERNDTGALYEEILEAARSLMRADFASIQMCAAERNELLLLAHHGFHPESARFWSRVSLDGKSSCALAMHRRELTIVPDVEICEEFAGSDDLDEFRRSGIRAVQSTPLTSRDGGFVGMISTHWRDVHTPSQRELRLFGVVARQAADWIERHLAEGALRASEEKYRALFENVDEGVARIELLFDERGQPNDFRWLDYNPAFTRHTGLANVLGKRGREAVPNFDADVLEIYAGVARAGQGIRFERFAPKLERWFSIFVSPVLGDANQLVVIFANVTERKRAEEALRRSEARNAYLVRLGDALRPLGDPGAVKRAAMQVLGEQLAVNRAFYGEFDGDDLLVEHAYESGVPPMPVGGPSKPSPAPWMRATLRAGENVIIADVRTDSRFASELRDGALSIHAIGAVTVPMMKDGRLASSVSVHTDSPRTWAAEEVSLIEETAERTWEAVERARAEAALRESERAARTLLGEATRARADAEAANRAKDEFLATLSHELRTPLAAMLLWARSMRAGGVKPAEISRAVDAIVQSAESQSRLIDDLLDLSRLTAGRIELQRSAVDLRRVVEQAVDTVKPMAAEKSVNLLVSVHREMGSVLLDEQRVKQVLWNLLSNAVKFTPKGGTVRVGATTVEGFIELEVIDDGEGIDAAFLPHVFDKFRQADMADTRRHMGLGIGLTIAKRLTELHGGSIAATSAGLGLGAKFRIRLPWVPAIAPPAPSRPGTFTPLDGLRTLLVEDDTSTLLAMKSSLENAGARVAPFEDGGEALAALERGLDVDVIVSDLGLPRMSGFELIARIGRHYTKDGRPIPPSCAVSAHAREVDRRAAIDAGFDVYLAKPTTPERLVEAVADLGDVARQVEQG